MFNAKQLRSASGHIASLVVLAICTMVAILLYVNRQLIVDQISVWQYQPSEAIATIAKRSSMNDAGSFYFYTSHPAIEDAEKFNKECDKKEASTAILGCYNGRYIYIYNVTDSKLDGIREVTAAHEMLHVVYARLGDAEKTEINKLLEAEYEKLKGDKEFAERMAFYARTEPGERHNELHSIIGTEVVSLDPALENYYKKYFHDRSVVTSLHKKYASVFLDLQKQSDALSQQLTQLENTIEADSVKYNSDVNQLNKDIASFNAKANKGEFGSNDQFAAERRSLVTRAERLDTQRQAINSSIERFNQLRDELVSIASQSEALNRSVNSSLAPAPSL